MDRVCYHCGEPLIRKGGEGARDWRRRRFCGYACSSLSRSAARAEAKAQRDDARRRSCFRCGTVFLPPLRSDRPSPYCSRSCSNAAKGDRERCTAYEVRDCGYITPCHVWTGAKQTREGICYGKVSVGGKTLLAHRYVYTIEVGPIPDGHHLDHLCEVPLCVRGDHLEPVTPAENTRRSWQRGRHDAKRKRAV